jgi:hypothetical protein
MTKATITDTTFTLGEVSFPIDRNNIVTSIDALDKLNAGAWTALAVASDLPVSPFEKRLIKPVLMGVIQEAWYLNIKGSVSEKCLLNQKNRVTRYKQQLEELTSGDGDDKVFRIAKSRPETKERVSMFYKLLPGYEAKIKEFKTQKYMTMKAIVDAGDKNLTVNQMAAAIEQMPEAKFAGTVSAKNISGLVCNFMDLGIIQAVDAEGQPVERKATPKKDKPVADVKASASPTPPATGKKPATTNKKK